MSMPVGYKIALVVGREREEAALSRHLEDALSGEGSLVLMSGEAGIGKTTLVRSLIERATDRGFVSLTGACYDAHITPPYGPWRELVSRTTRQTDLPAAPALLLDNDQMAKLAHADQFINELREYLEAIVDRRPALIVLEDLHWADPESLDFLRYFARRVNALPLLLVATYREDEMRRNQSLYQLVPHLVRESNAQRISLPPLAIDDIQDLVRQTYDLSDADRDRLTTYLAMRSQGVPIYLRELLQLFEEQQHLRQTAEGWRLGDLQIDHVPVLVRQVISGRLARLGVETCRELELAAVIGQEVPLLLWRQLSDAADETFQTVVEQAMEFNFIDEAPSGLSFQFSHALVRDSVYEEIPLMRRQRLHRRIAEVLAEGGRSEPETVAYHFRQALDQRAVEWFIQAGNRIERVAWVTAAGHFEAALEMMGTGDVDANERGWLLMRRAKLLSTTRPHTALAILHTAESIARDAGDPLLSIYATFYRGQTRCLAGEMQAGIRDLETSIDALARLPPDELQRVNELERLGVVQVRSEIDGLLAAMLAASGRVDEAIAYSQSIIDRTRDTPVRAWWTRAIALAIAGRPQEARQAFMICRDTLLRASDDSNLAFMLLYLLSNVQIPYDADNLIERRRIASEAELAWQRSGGGLGDVSPRLASVMLLELEGHWREAEELARSAIRASNTTSEQHLQSTVILVQLALARGDATPAWDLIHELLPGGSQTTPGHVDFVPGMALVRLAVRLCLASGNLAAATAWLDLHDRWLAWSGAVLGQADGQLLWAHYHQVAGDLMHAHQNATEAHSLASDPRQPLTLLVAHRMLGELEALRGQFTQSREHLDTALALADACVAPYERALTLLSLADLERRSGAIAEAAVALDEARSVFIYLGAVQALKRADALQAQLDEQTTASDRTAPFDLSPREIEVLRLIASGKRNREIAETLFVSVRTVERHITNLYTKIGAASRSEAIAFAHDHNLI